MPRAKKPTPSGSRKQEPSPPLVVRETVSLYDAKTNLSSLVERAAGGEEIVISKSGKPKARLVPMGEARVLRVPGRGRGRWKVRKDFDDRLPDDLLAAFGHPKGGAGAG